MRANINGNAITQHKRGGAYTDTDIYANINKMIFAYSCAK